MSIFAIPTQPNTPFYSQRVTLDGVPFILTFTYIQRGKYWKLSIADDNGNDLVNGIKLVSNYLLLTRFATTGLPAGNLLVWASSPLNNQPADIGELGIGLRCELTYYDAAEIAADDAQRKVDLQNSFPAPLPF